MRSSFSKVQVKGASFDEHMGLCAMLCKELGSGKSAEEAKLLANLMKSELARKAQARAENP